MSVKSIFQQGMQEHRRRKSLGKMGREVKEKEKTLEGLLTTLGRKAWESGQDISRFKELGKTLQETQKTLDELGTQAEDLRSRQEKLEEKKTKETERYETDRKGVEGKKRDLDKRVKDQNEQLEEGQGEIRKAQARLAAIALERSQLKAKSEDAAATEEEKADLARKLDLLTQEEKALQAGINARAEAAKPIEMLVSSLREESDQVQKQLDELRKKQKEVVDDLDKRITEVKNELSRNSTRLGEIKKKRESLYHDLGEKLADNGTDFPKLAEEKAAVDNVRRESTALAAEITALEARKDATQVSAYKKMWAILIGGLVLLAAIVVGLILLLSPKDASSSSASAKKDVIKAAGKIQQEIAEQVEKRAGGRQAEVSGKETEAQLEEMKKQSGQFFSDTETTDAAAVASENALSRVLPDIHGWQKQDPEFSSGAAGNIQIATLDTRYISGEDSVRVHITDAASANSMIINAFKFTLSANIRIDNEERLSQVSSIKGVPVVEVLDRETGEARISLAHKDRYLIDLGTSSEKGLDLLREFAARLDLSKLP